MTSTPPPPSARPTNVTRSAFHVTSGLVALAALRLLHERRWLLGAAGAIAIAAWSMESSRRVSPRVNDALMRLFAPVAHDNERYRVNSSTWYVTALLLLAAFAPPSAAELGVLVLAVADPIAGMIGRRFGRTRLRAGRSLEGTLGFFAAGTLASLAWLLVASPGPLGPSLVLATAGAAAGALAELASTRLDDNFTIPIVTTAAVAAAQLAL